MGKNGSFVIFRKKKKTQTNDKKVIGAYLPQTLILELELYCIKNGDSKSDIVQKAITAFFKSENIEVGCLEDSIVENAISVYKSLSGVSYSDFVAQTKKELLTKVNANGFEQIFESIDTIILKLKEHEKEITSKSKK